MWSMGRGLRAQRVVVAVVNPIDGPIEPWSDAAALDGVECAEGEVGVGRHIHGCGQCIGHNPLGEAGFAEATLTVIECAHQRVGG